MSYKTSKDSVAKCLKRLNYTNPYPIAIPLLSEKNRILRLEWAKKNSLNNWKHSALANEASVWLSRERIRMWTKGGSVRLSTTIKHTQRLTFGPRFHQWARSHSVYPRIT